MILVVRHLNEPGLEALDLNAVDPHIFKILETLQSIEIQVLASGVNSRLCLVRLGRVVLDKMNLD